MDDPALDAGAHGRALEGLRRLNHLGGTARATWSALEPIRPPTGGEPLRVLDLATGSGDLPLALWRRARARKFPMELLGLDVSPVAIGVARARARAAGAAITFERADVLKDELPAGCDVVTCSLFLHHLDADDAVFLLRRAGAAARRLLVVDDLARSAVGLGLVTAATWLVTRSPVVHHDGPASVRAAFNVQEIARLARAAGLRGAVVRRRPPVHLQLVWRRPA